MSFITMIYSTLLNICNVKLSSGSSGVVEIYNKFVESYSDISAVGLLG